MSETTVTYPRIYYERSKLEWTDEEQQQIIKEYNDDEMNIIQIGNLHKRTPGGISYKLHKLGVMSNRLNARGYPEYKASALYQEIASMPRERKNEQNKDANIPEQVTNNLKKPGRIISELQEIKELLKIIVTKL